LDALWYKILLTKFNNALVVALDAALEIAPDFTFDALSDVALDAALDVAQGGLRYEKSSWIGSCIGIFAVFFFRLVCRRQDCGLR